MVSHTRPGWWSRGGPARRRGEATAEAINRLSARQILRIPVWTVAGMAIAIAFGVAAIAAGQAVGPVLSGSIGGTAPVTVSQAITLDTGIPFGKNPWFGNQTDLLGEANEPNDGVSTRNEDATAFTVAAEVSTGQKFAINIYLRNTSKADTAATLELNVPRGLDVDLADIDRPMEGGSNVSGLGAAITTNAVREARMNATTWLLSIGSDAGRDGDDGVTLTVRPRGDIAPGFYSITGRITQIRG